MKPQPALKRAALIALLIAVAQTFPMGQGQSSQSTLPLGLHHRWMAEVFSRRDSAMDQSLARFIFPGTHDSGTHGLRLAPACEDCEGADRFFDVDASCREELPTALEGICSAAGTYMAIVGQAWGEAQHLTVGAMLDAGARHFDLRFFRATADDAARSNGELVEGTFYIHHSLAGPDSTAILNDIDTFLDEPSNAQEIVILEFSKMKEGDGEMDAATIGLFFDEVRNRFGDRMAEKKTDACAVDSTGCSATQRFGDATTLREFLAQGSQVIVTCASCNIQADDIWSSITSISPWDVSSIDANAGIGYPAPDNTYVPWRNDQELASIIEQLSVTRDSHPQDEMFALGTQIGLDDGGKSLIRGLTCHLDPENAFGECGAVNDDWDHFQGLQDVADFTNPMALAAVVGLRRDRVNIVTFDHYSTAITEEIFKLNLGATQVKYQIDSVTENSNPPLQSLDFDSNPDYYPVFLFEFVPPALLGVRVQRYNQIQNDSSIAPDWPAWKSYPNDWGTAVVQFGLRDADGTLGGDDDWSPINLPVAPFPRGTNLNLVTESVPITGCVTSGASCLSFSDLQTTTGDPADASSEVTYRRSTCVWSWLPGDLVDTGSPCDELLPQISVFDVARPEGNSGSTALDIVVALSAPSLKTVTAELSTIDDSAIAGSDYVPLTNTTVTFAPGQTRVNASVFVTGDTDVEGNESFTVTLRNPGNATIQDGRATGTIVNDDIVLPSLSIDDVTAAEGNTGTTPFTFTVSLSEASGGISSVFYSVGGGTATAGSDYAAVPRTELVFARGEASKTVTVNVNGDTAVEDDETFVVTLFEVKGATIADGAGTGTILNDDLAPSMVTPPPQSGTEGSNATFDLGKLEDPRPGAGPWNVTVKWGDATTETFPVSALGAVPRAHLYTDNGVYTVTVHATDPDGAQSPPSTFTITIANANPTATLGNNGPVAEGGAATISFSAPSDPSSNDTTAGFRYAFSCTNTPLSGATYANSSPNPSTTCSFPDNAGTRNVRGRIIDKDGGFTDYTTVVTVTDAPPAITAPPPQSGFEGAAGAFNLGTLADPGADGPWSVTVSWGDGGTSTYAANQPGPLAGSHAYADNGSYTVSVSVQDADNVTSAPIAFPANIANVAPQVTAGGSSIAENGVATVTGTIADPGVLDGFTMTVSWGDGASGQYTLAPGTTTYAVTHRYLDDSPMGTPVDVLPVLIAVVDKDGGPGSTGASVTVANVAPVVGALTLTDDAGTALGTDLVTLTGLPIALAAPFTDAGSLDTHVGTITWGDSTSGPGTVVQGTGGSTVRATHAWNQVGTVTVRVAVTDDDTGVGSRETTISVVDGSGAVCGLGNRLKPLLNDPKVSAITKLKLKLLAVEIEFACGFLTNDLYVPALVKLVIAVATNDLIIKGGNLSAANLAVLQQVQARLMLTGRWTYLQLTTRVTSTY